MTAIKPKPFPQHSRIATKIVGDQGISQSFMRQYSKMKYGQVEATESIAEDLFSSIIQSPILMKMLSEKTDLFVTSAAYGSVPTAAHSIMKRVVAKFSDYDYNIRTFKITREGNFHQANYGSLDFQSRKLSLNSRHIFVSDEVKDLISGQNILIIDDLFATGAHETALVSLLSQHTELSNLIFAYPVVFETNFGQRTPGFESDLNRAQVETIEDLIHLHAESQYPLTINSRLVKFVLQKETADQESLIKLLHTFGPNYCLELYAAAISSDGYFDLPGYKQGFGILKNELRNLANSD